MKQNPNAAVIFFQGAIEIEPALCDAYDLLGFTFMELKEYDNALDVLQQSLVLNSTNIRAIKLKGHCLLLKRDYQNAYVFYQEQYHRQPDNIDWSYHFIESLIGLDSINRANKEISLLIRDLRNINADLGPAYYL